MQIRVLLVAAVLCNAVGFQFMPRLGRRFALSLSEAGGVGGDENGDGEVERSGVGTDEKLGDLISSIVSSFKNGTSVQKGFVTSTGRSLDVKILDPDIQADIWSGYTTDDAEVLAINALMEASKLQLGGVGADTDTDTGVGGVDSDVDLSSDIVSRMMSGVDDINGALLARLKKEARETMREIRDDRVGEAEEEAAVAAAVAEAVAAITKSASASVPPAAAAPAGVRQVGIDVSRGVRASAVATVMSITGAGTGTGVGVGVGTEADVGTPNFSLSTEADEMEGGEWEGAGEEAEGQGGGEGGAGERLREQVEGQVEGQGAERQSTADALGAAAEAAAGLAGAGTDESVNVVAFTSFLQANIENAQAQKRAGVGFGKKVLGSGEGEGGIGQREGGLVEVSDLASSTVTAVQGGNIELLDVRGILGEALFSLSDSLGIDMQTELKGKGAQTDINNIMAGGMAELTLNMAQLDEESAALYARLESLKSEIRAETVEFEGEKKEELDLLLEQQAGLQSEWVKSQEQLKASTERLENVVRDLNENADIITSLALFPLKSTPQKTAFVVGLSLLLKVPYDISALVSLRETDFSDLFGVLVQAGVCLACLNEYGILRPILNEIRKKIGGGEAEGA